MLELPKATVLFKKIAEQRVDNDNRVLGQLLYGLALRYISLIEIEGDADMVGDVRQICRKQ